MGEPYVRPPLVAREAKGDRLAVWRFRLIAILVLIVLTALVGWGLFTALDLGAEDPGFGGLGQLTAAGSAAP